MVMRSIFAHYTVYIGISASGFFSKRITDLAKNPSPNRHRLRHIFSADKFPDVQCLRNETQYVFTRVSMEVIVTSKLVGLRPILGTYNLLILGVRTSIY